MALFDSLYGRACNASSGSQCGFRQKLRDGAIMVSLLGATFAVAAQTIVDGPTTCGANPLNWARYTDDALQVGTMYGTRLVPLEQCSTLQPGELCISVFAYNLANTSVADIFTGPPPRDSTYPYSIAIDPSDQNHLLYITRDELIETYDRGQSWHYVNDMVAVRASAGRDAGRYFLNFTPDGLTLIEGNQVSDDAGRNWRTLSHFPELVTHQSVYYEISYHFTGWRSNDRGSSWSPLMLDGYPLNLTNVWTADATDSTLLYAYISGNFGYRIARSRDGGDNWKVLMNVGPNDPIRLYPVLASPDTSGLVYVLGLEQATRRVRLWKSTDAGDTWVPFGGQVWAHLGAAGCGTVAILSGVLNSDARGIPLVFNTSAGSMILFDAPGVAPPTLERALSRKVHGTAGTFDLSLSLVATDPTTEPRQGPTQSIVFSFDKPIAAATASTSEGTATAGTPTFSGNDVIVGLSGVTDQQYVTISLTNVTPSDGGQSVSAGARIGFLVGDVSQNRVVTVADLAWVNGNLAQTVTAANFLSDVNANGTLTVADRAITNANLSKALPAP